MTTKFVWNPSAKEFVPLPRILLDGEIARAFETFQKMDPEYREMAAALERLAAEIRDLDWEIAHEYTCEECLQI